jgi:hypothetical protein
MERMESADESDTPDALHFSGTVFTVHHKFAN